MSDNATVYIPNNLETRVALGVQETELNEEEPVMCNIASGTVEDGRGSISWPYMNTFEKLFGSAPDINPKAVVATMEPTQSMSTNVKRSGMFITSPHPSPTSNNYNPVPSSSVCKPIDCNVDSDENMNSFEPVQKRRRRLTQNEEPEWVSVLRKEATNGHKEKMELLKELINVLKKE
ncbi:hypothetical protein FQA39_LY18134 [Lamprigera yunnana]|nr:hypothetical protein FQA39_LY18134 [Lamprigera yunnana]